MASASDNCVIYYQTKTPISFWCKWRLNIKSLIQLSKILPVERIEIYGKVEFNLVTKLWWCYIYTQFAKSTKSLSTPQFMALATKHCRLFPMQDLVYWYMAFIKIDKERNHPRRPIYYIWHYYYFPVDLLVTSWF